MSWTSFKKIKVLAGICAINEQIVQGDGIKERPRVRRFLKGMPVSNKGTHTFFFFKFQ